MRSGRSVLRRLGIPVLAAVVVLMTGASAGTPVAQAENGFSLTGYMSTARGGNTATLLPSGKVLFAGGFSFLYSRIVASELYDPSAGTFSATGTLTTARVNPTATLLPNGKVLIAGGFNAGEGAYLTSSELYDPSTGIFVESGQLLTGRESHTATLLADGKVLIAGGYGSSGALDSAELYDPTTGSFTATGSMHSPHSGPTATLLPSGKVLITGGYSGSSVVSTAAELYDPSTGGFTAAGSMTTSRYIHRATLLPSGKVLITGGRTYSGALDSAELYDPTTGSFTATGSMSTSREGHTATLLAGGKVMIAGGDDDNKSLTGSELYDPSTGRFESASRGSMYHARSGHTATLLASGQVLLAGGIEVRSSELLGSAELYDPLEPVLTGLPAPATRSTSASISFAGEPLGSFTCSVDGGEYVDCASPKDVTELSEGEHYFRVRQTDLAGRTSSAATAYWTVDRTPPRAPMFGTKPATLSNSPSATFSFGGEIAATFICSIDGREFSPCTPTASFNFLSEGAHSLSVKQIDSAGNTGIAAATFSWTVDLTPPAAPVLSGTPAPLTNLKTAKISFTAATDKSFTCSLDGASPIPCSTSKSLTGLNEGRHSFVVRHNDPAGNVSSATASWLVDTTLPTLRASASGGRIKTRSQTSYLLSPNVDASGVVKVEYATSSSAPALNAKNVASKTVAYASPVVFKTTSAIKWIRLQDGAGNWSRWYQG